MTCSDYEDKDPKLYNYELSWKINLSTMYSRYLVKGVSTGDFCDEPNELLSNIDALLNEVIAADDLIGGDEMIDHWDLKFKKAEALTGLANARNKFFRRFKLPYSHVEIDEYYRRALKTIAPRKKSFILQSYGKYKAYCANSVDEYLESTSLLEEAVELNPENNIAVYELARAYKMAWYFAENQKDKLEQAYKVMHLGSGDQIKPKLFSHLGN